MEIHGKLVDVHNKMIFPATITVAKGIIVKIERNSHRGKGFILPGFVDAHIHIESSLLPPSEFARLAVRHGTVATVSDPHAIINDYLLENASKVPLKFYFKTPAPNPTIKCETLSEAREKRGHGTKILIREGSAAKNLNALFPLLQEAPDDCMFCSDYLQPQDLALGHINLLVKRAIQKGMDPITAICCASKNPIEYYGLEVGLLRVGDPADFIIVDDLISFRVHETYIDGECIFKNSTLFPPVAVHPINHFDISLKEPKDFTVPIAQGDIDVIEVFSTGHLKLPPAIKRGQIVADVRRDILKIAIVNRYQDAPPSVGFIKGFGLKKGALASSIAYDSRNIIAVGVTDGDLCRAVNAVIESWGGLALSSNGTTDILPLPIAGLMSTLSGEETARRYSDLTQMAKNFGTTLQDPFLTLSFIEYRETK